MQFNLAAHIYWMGATLIAAIHFMPDGRNLWATFLDKRHYMAADLGQDLSLRPRNFTQRLAIAAHNLQTQVSELSLTEPRVLVAFFLGLLACLLLLRPLDLTFFENNLLPELFGFALEGLLITGVMSALYQRRENREKEGLRALLTLHIRRYSHFINHNVLSSTISREEIRKGREAIHKVLNRFTTAASIRLSPDEQVFTEEARKMALTDRIQAQGLTSAAARLSNAHLSLWIDYIEALDKLASSETHTDAIHALIDILGADIGMEHDNFRGWRSKMNLQQLVNYR